MLYLSHDHRNMADNGENGGGLNQGEAPPQQAVEHLNIKVTDNNNEVFFKIKRNTKLEKLMTAFCERQGKSMQSVRFLFEGQRVQPTDTPDTVRLLGPEDSEHVEASWPVQGFPASPVPPLVPSQDMCRC